MKSTLSTSMLVAVVAASTWASPSPQEGDDDLLELLLAAPGRASWSASCRGRVEPDHALIVGGVSARSLKPSDARARLETQLEAIRSFAERSGGELTLLERTRAVQDNRDRHRGGRLDEESPFLVVQWLEVRLPVETPVDDLLDELLRIGLDRYGRADSWNPGDSRPRYLVRYGFSDLEAELDRVREACREEAWRSWCENSGRGVGCVAAYPAIDRHIEMRSLNLSSRPIARPTGGAAQLQLGYPWSPAQIDDIELIGRVPLMLRGQIGLGLQGR